MEPDEEILDRFLEQDIDENFPMSDDYFLTINDSVWRALTEQVWNFL